MNNYYIVRTWTKTAHGWTSEYNSFRAREDAEAYGMAHIKNTDDGLDKGFDIEVTYGDTVFQYQYNDNGACIGQRNRGAQPGCFWTDWEMWGDDDTLPDEE